MKDRKVFWALTAATLAETHSVTEGAFRSLNSAPAGTGNRAPQKSKSFTKHDPTRAAIKKKRKLGKAARKKNRQR